MNIRHRIAAVLTAGLFLFPLAGCGKTTVLPPETEPEGILTNVFTGEEIVLPAKLTFCNNCTPYYDAAAGTYTFLAQSETIPRKYHLLTFDATGAVTENIELDADLNGLQESAVTADGIVARVGKSANAAGIVTTSTLLRIASDGTTAESEDLSALLGVATDEFMPQGLAADAEGNLYFKYFDTVFVLDKTLNLSFSLACDASNISVRDGVVWIGTSDGVAPVDTEKKSLGEKIPLPEGITAIECFAADGYALCYRTSEGIYALSKDGTTVERILNYQNSGLIENRTELLCFIDRDTLLLRDGGKIGFWTRAADIDLSEITVLDVAYTTTTHYDTSFLLQKISEFNRLHPEIRVVTRDYQIYRDGGIVLSEESTLVRDMLTGVYQPDVFITRTDSPELASIYENDLYLDLYPLIDADEDLSRDDFFGCVFRTFEDSRGKLMALCSRFDVTTLVGDTERLNGMTSWTTEEMLGFASALPEDELFMVYLAQNNASSMLYGNGYSAFIDLENATCSFDSPEFIGYLDFLKTLPEKFDTTPYGTDKWREVTKLANSVVQQKTYCGFSDWVKDRFLYEGRDTTQIGYISDGESRGSASISTTPYLITKYCDTPDAAWTFLKEVMMYTGELRENHLDEVVYRTDDGYSAFSSYNWLFSALKQDHVDSVEAGKKLVYQEKGSSLYDPENPPSEKNGPYFFLTDEDADKMYRWLEEDVGIPYTGSLDRDVRNIVNEEISAYLGGAQTAEQCADIIQSRVGLWLSEHE